MGSQIIVKNRNSKKSIIRFALATAFLLLIPLVAMQFTDEVDWSLFDFVFAGVLLFGSGLAYELISRTSGNVQYRVAVGIGVVTSLLLIWINGAVGIIGSENNPANLLHGGVLSVGFLGAIIARLRPLGMSWVLFAMALVQAMVPMVAMIIWRPSLDDTPGIVGVFVLNAFFVMLFVGSGLLFRQASVTGEKSAAV